MALSTLLMELRVNPERLIRYLEIKIKEDRTIQQAHPDLYQSTYHAGQDTDITNAELLLLHLRSRVDRSV